MTKKTAIWKVISEKSFLSVTASLSYLHQINYLLNYATSFFSLKQSSVPFSYSVVSDSLQPNGPGFPVHHQFPELTQFMSIKSVMPSNHFILCWPLLLSPSIFPSIRVYSGESVLLIRWPKY